MDPRSIDTSDRRTHLSTGRYRGRVMTGSAPDEPEGTGAFRETLARRERVLDALAAGPTDQRDLRDALDVSRSTAYKSLRELEDAGLVRQVEDGCYRLTQFGSLVHRCHAEYVARIGRLREARPVAEALPDDLLVPLAFVERGHRVVASSHAPERGDLVVELLVESGAVDYLREYDRLDEALATDGFDLLRIDEPLEFGLFVDDDRELAALFAYGPQGGVAGMLLSDALDAYRWADRTYRRYRETARSVEPSS
jgi:DNA-binding transcriptional ArsR family regulator